jgi:hypothetical protein
VLPRGSCVQSIGSRKSWEVCRSVHLNSPDCAFGVWQGLSLRIAGMDKPELTQGAELLKQTTHLL